MNKKILGIVAIVIILIGGFFLFQSQNQKDSERLNVVASFYPLYYFASEIGGDKVNVTNLTPAGSEPHDFEPSARDTANILEADLVVINGAGFEPWFEGLESDLDQNKIVVTTNGINLEEGSRAHEHGHEEEAHEEEEKHGDEESEEHEEEVLDPHVWLSPKLAKEQVNNILQGFVKTDPENREFYEENARNLTERLDTLNSQIESGLSQCSQKVFISSHSAFKYFAGDYGLEQVSISGLSPEEDPSAAKIAEIVEEAREHNVKYIFFEALVSPRLSETIASEVEAGTLVLDPIEGLSEDDINSGEDYFTIMETNLGSLQTALECET